MQKVVVDSKSLLNLTFLFQEKTFFLRTVLCHINVRNRPFLSRNKIHASKNVCFNN